MEDLIVLGIFVALALLICLNIYISRQFQLVANDKGYTEEKYFWICFFLGVVGYILVAALPQKTLAKMEVNPQKRGIAVKDDCKNVSDPVKEANYLTAIALANNGNYDEATLMLRSLDNYKDSNELILKFDTLRR